MVKVFIGFSWILDISETKMLESSPPLRKDPKGTSDIILYETEERNSDLNSS